MQLKKPIWIIGIHTDVGKTTVSGLVARALRADYWKPVQAGSLDRTDSHRAGDMLQNTASVVHPEAHCFIHAMSPHAAAELEQMELDLNTLQMPPTSGNLVIETAGGLFSPFNANATMLDLIQRWPGYVILVSKHYVGSINHTLLTIEALEKFGIELIGIIYSDVENTSTESFIAQHKPGYPSLRTGIVDESKIEEVDRKASEMEATLIEWLQ